MFDHHPAAQQVRDAEGHIHLRHPTDQPAVLTTQLDLTPGEAQPAFIIIPADRGGLDIHPQRRDSLIDREFNLIGQEIERDRPGRQPPGQCDDQNDQQAGQHRRTLKAQDQRSAAAMPEAAQPQITGRDIVFPSSVIGRGVSRRLGDIMMFINHVLSMVL